MKTCLIQAGFVGEAFDIKLDSSFDFLGGAGFVPDPR